MSLQRVPHSSPNESRHRTVIATTVNELIRTKLDWYGESSTSVVITNGSTVSTAARGSSRVNPAGAVTGIILEAGTQPAQVVVVLNESASSVTFAAAGTSFVADGTSSVIAAKRCAMFVWDSSTSLWYRT
jgi:hypothetical protein